MNPTTTLSNRRAVLKLSAAASMVGFAVPALARPPSADAELIAACAAYDDLNRRFCDVCETDDDEERMYAAQKYLSARMNTVLDRICSLQATTVEGFKARGATLALFIPEVLEKWGESKYDDDRMLFALMRDLAAGGTWS